MKKESFRKIEGALYGYFRDKETLRRIEQEIYTLDIRIEKIRKDITECNININPYPSGGAGERVQTSTNTTSHVEREMSRQIGELERELAHTLRKKYKKNAKIRDIESKISNMDASLKNLDEEDRFFINLKYGKELTFQELQFKIEGYSTSSLKRKRDRIVEKLKDIA